MPAPDIVLGVELEFEVKDPGPHSTYISPYPVVKSWPKGHTNGFTHQYHGHVVRKIEEASGGFIRVGYDASVADGWGGFECYSQPGSLLDQIQAWGAFYDAGLDEFMNTHVTGKTPGGQPKECGMHIHFSGSAITPITLANMLMFINNRANEKIVTYLSGRYDTFYCKIKDGLSFDDALCLFHSDDCMRSEWKGTRINDDMSYLTHVHNPNTGGYSYTYCCKNTEKYQNQKQTHFWMANVTGPNGGTFLQRPALNVLTTKGTGDGEFRMFKTPTAKPQCLGSMEFVHSLIRYCGTTSPRDVNYVAYCDWLMEELVRRVKYRNLFKWLREDGYVAGLIPRRKNRVGGTRSNP